MFDVRQGTKVLLEVLLERLGDDLVFRRKHPEHALRTDTPNPHPGVPFVAMIRPWIVKHAPTKAGLLLHPGFGSMSAGRRLSPGAALASRIIAAPTATKATTAEIESTRLPKLGNPTSPLHLASPPPLLPLRVAVRCLRTGSCPLHPKREPGKGR